MIRFYNEDVRKGLEKLEDKSISLAIIDPPYFINYDTWDGNPKDFKEFTEAYLQALIPKMKKDGTIWIFMAYQNLFTHKHCEKGLVNILDELPGKVHLENWVTWTRMKGRGSKKKLKSLKEEIVHYTMNPAKFVWNEQKVLREVIAPYVKDGRPRGWWVSENGTRVRWTGIGNVWLYSSPQWNGILDKQIHSAQKPFLMYERLILLSSNPGDLVVDPFMGSGVSGIVARMLGRNYVGIENNKVIFDKAIKHHRENYHRIEEEYQKHKKEAKFEL